MGIASIVLLAAAAAAPVRGDARYTARGDEIVALVRDNFFDAARAQAWAAKHRGYAAEVRDATVFATRTNEVLAELATSHTAYYPRGGSEHPMLSAIFQDGLKTTPTYASLGIDLARTANGVFVRRVFPGGAGEAAGLRRGDRIVALDGKPPPGATQPLVTRAGQAVRLTVQRKPAEPPIELRAVPVLVNPRQEWLGMQRTGSRTVGLNGARVAYHPMFSCAGTDAEAALRDALAGDLAAADALVLDFRDGWGGCRPELVDVFSPLAPTVTSIGRGDKRATTWTGWRRPVVLLVNSGSRSGKEVVAYALKQRHAARVVGERTAGAVMTGRVLPLSDGSLLYVAVADLLVDGARLEGVGVFPDVELRDFLEYAGGYDMQLEQAFELAAEDARKDAQFRYRK